MVNISRRVTIPISIGELIDKVAILRIKERRIRDLSKRPHVLKELALLSDVIEMEGLDTPEIRTFMGELTAVNETLWELEAAIRECEARSDFGDAFVALARRIYAANDHRSSIKSKINQFTGSHLVEEKWYGIAHGK